MNEKIYNFLNNIWQKFWIEISFIIIGLIFYIFEPLYLYFELLVIIIFYKFYLKPKKKKKEVKK